MIRRALISVSDKTGLDVFARGLADLGVELVASGGTTASLKEHGLGVAEVSDVTASPELLGGRVKTLHPRIHAGILARRDHDEDVEELAEHEIEPFDLVCVNLYPFQQVMYSAEGAHRADQALEMIDIGGPAMLRGAAKNFLHVAPVCSPDQYGFVLDELRHKGALSEDTRRALATEAFAYTARYEAAIASWFAERETFPDTLIVSLEKVMDLAYGENPHQRAACYAESGVRRHVLSRVRQIGGRALSFNNLNDLSAARRLLEEFAVPACVIVKHANPCGCAIGSSIDEAYERAHQADPMSAFGGVVIVNRPIEPELGSVMATRFSEVVTAPEIADEALVELKGREGLRILLNEERRRAVPGERDYRRVIGGVLVQDTDAESDDRDGMEVVVGDPPSEERWGDLLFAWRVVRHVSSNAIVIGKDLMTIGIGAGQMSRVDAVRLAIEKAHEQGHDIEGAVLASDAFFPFADGPELALDAGIASIIQPGGSKRDDEVVAAVRAAGASMVFTARRHFRH